MKSFYVFGILILQGYLCIAFGPISFSQNGGKMTSVHMAKSVYERVLEKPQFPADWPFSEDDFTRMDESDDTIFYNSPRL